MIPLGVVLSCYTILPIFYNTKSDSVFTYIELRFGTLVSQICLIFSMISWMTYVAAVLLTPSLALKTIMFDKAKNVTSNPTEIAQEVSEDWVLYLIIFVLAFVCIFYTFIGGMNAVIWADTVNGVSLIVG
jgi:Na+/proline symporter